MLPTLFKIELTWFGLDIELVLFLFNLSFKNVELDLFKYCTDDELLIVDCSSLTIILLSFKLSFLLKPPSMLLIGILSFQFIDLSESFLSNIEVNPVYAFKKEVEF